jgi:hypothetical protein
VHTINVIGNLLRGGLRKMKNNKSAFPYLYEEGMTLSQYAAIHLNVPMSGDPEIDKMIRESRRLDLAGQMLEGFCSGPNEPPDPKRAAEWCCEAANAMLAEWEKEAGK